VITNGKIEDVFFYLLGPSTKASIRLRDLAFELNLPNEVVARGLDIYAKTPLGHRRYIISKTGFLGVSDYEIEVQERA